MHWHVQHCPIATAGAPVMVSPPCCTQAPCHFRHVLHATSRTNINRSPEPSTASTVLVCKRKPAHISDAAAVSGVPTLLRVHICLSMSQCHTGLTRTSHQSSHQQLYDLLVNMQAL